MDTDFAISLNIKQSEAHISLCVKGGQIELSFDDFCGTYITYFERKEFKDFLRIANYCYENSSSLIKKQLANKGLSIEGNDDNGAE